MMYSTMKEPMPSRQRPKKVPRTFFQVNSLRMPLFLGLPDGPDLPPPLPLAALRAAARPPPSTPAAGDEDELGGAARWPPRCRARLSSARPMSPLAPLRSLLSHRFLAQVSSES